MTMGSMFVGGTGGDAMFGAGMGVDAFAMLASPKLMKGANNLAAKLALSAKSGTKLAAPLKAGLANIKDLVNQMLKVLEKKVLLFVIGLKKKIGWVEPWDLLVLPLVLSLELGC